MRDVLSAVTPFENRWILEKNNQQTNDIIRSIMKHHDRYAPEYDKIADKFWTGDAESTARNLFDYLKANVPYRIEPDKMQTVRSPAAILSMKGGDCKHYSSFIVGVLDALKRKGIDLNPVYRFASYKMYDDNPHHVFAVLKMPGGKEYWIDPVLRTFDNRKRYYSNVDKKPKNMLYSVGYTVTDSINGKGKAKRQAKRAEKKAKRAPKKAARKAKRAARPKGLKNKLKKLNPLLVTARNSYLLMLKMNLFRLASKVGKKVQERPQFRDELKKEWEKLGGNFDKLKLALNQGIKVWNKRHNPKVNAIGYANMRWNRYGWDDTISGVDTEIDGVGVVQFAAAAAILAAATPIIIKLASLFKKNGINTDNLKEEAEDGAHELSEQVDNLSQTIQDNTGGGDDTMEGGGSGVKYAVSKTQNADGTETLNIKGSNIDNLENTPNLDLAGGGSGTYDDGSSSPVADFMNTAKGFVMRNKKAFMIGGGVVAAAIVLPPIIRAVKPTTRRRR